MRVARLYGARDIRLCDEPAPPEQAGTCLVRVTAVGICGSDLHWYCDGGIGDARLEHPLVVGHEMAGRIEGGPRDGERVAVDPAVPCGACARCREGNPNLCPSILFAGHGRQDGGLRELLRWPAGRLHAVPATITDEQAALLEPLGVALHSLDLGHLTVGATVGVFGCGPIGLLLIQLARAAGAGWVVVADPLAHRRAAAAARGADEVLEGAGWTGPDAGVDVAFEAAGTDDAVATAVAAARPGARLVLVGIPDTDRITLCASVARRKGLTIALVRRMKDVYPRAIDVASRGVVDLGSLVSHRYPLDRVDEAFRRAAARTGLKVVVEPNRQR